MIDELAATVSPNRRPDRRSPYDLSGLVFRVATEAEWEELLNVRWKGYQQYGYVSPADCQNRHDARATHFICRDETTDEILGCVRMLSSLDGRLELEEFVDISEWLCNGAVPAELTRFSIPFCRSLPAIKNGLMKLAWLEAVNQGHTHFIITTQQKTKPGYDWLGFHHYLGRQTTFLHPMISNNLHYVMTIDLISDTRGWRERVPPLYEFFWETDHPNLLTDSHRPMQAAAA